MAHILCLHSLGMIALHNRRRNKACHQRTKSNAPDRCNRSRLAPMQGNASAAHRLIPANCPAENKLA
jgi:hypothetical protein